MNWDNEYSVYTSSPIDDWFDFWHIKKLHIPIIDYIQKNPTCEFTYSQVWNSVLNKIYYAYHKCKRIDLELRDADIYIYLNLFDEDFQTAILFKSDNNGTVNLIIDNRFDEKDFIRNIRHEQGCEWEKIDG